MIKVMNAGVDVAMIAMVKTALALLTNSILKVLAKT